MWLRAQTQFQIAKSLLVVAAISLALAPGANAQSDSYKVGVVNVKEVFDNFEGQKTAYKNLETERNSAQKPLDDMESKIKKLQDRYQAEASTLDPDDRRDLETTIESELGRYKAEFQRLQDDIDRKEKRMLEQLFEQIYESIQEVGLQGDYHMIFEGGDPGRTDLLYFSSTINMTQRVIDHLNAKQAAGD